MVVSMLPSLFSCMILFSSVYGSTCQTGNICDGSTAPKVIIDTDFNTIGDDGQVLAMAAQLHAANSLDILGLTIVTGNQYLNQGVSDALKAVERLGLERCVGVYAGASTPLLHDYTVYQLETQLFGNATAYVGAYLHPESNQVVPPPDGYATHTLPRPQHAVDFLISSIHAFPHAITLLAIGPLTNLALAIRLDPSILPLIHRIVIMGGQLRVAGNAFRGAAETNWWIDAEAARIVLRAPHLARKIIGLDVVHTVEITDATYDEIANREPATPVTKLFRDIERWPYVYDTLALASLHDESLDRDVRRLYVDVSTGFDAEYGKGVFWEEDPYPGTGVVSPSDVVFGFDGERFFEMYVDLMTRGVPVKVH